MSMLAKVGRFCRDYGVIYTARKVLYRTYIKYYLGGRYCPFAISEEERNKQSAWVPDRKVKISIVVPLYNTNEEFLVRTGNFVWQMPVMMRHAVRGLQSLCIRHRKRTGA